MPWSHKKRVLKKVRLKYFLWFRRSGFSPFHFNVHHFVDVLTFLTATATTTATATVATTTAKSMRSTATATTTITEIHEKTVNT
jgi:hypothetical protein